MSTAKSFSPAKCLKKFFLFVVALVGTLLAHAQLSDGVSATLQAGETTTVFYGFDAFKDAVTAAPDAGGIITLSPGAFSNPGNISKSMKIYGAGFQSDLDNNIGETRVNGHLNIVSTVEAVPVIRIEGVYFVNDVILSGTQKIENTEIVKCSFNSILQRVETNNTIVRQCYFRYDIGGENNKGTGFLVSNCLFRYVRGFAAGSSVTITHCIMFGNDGHNGSYMYSDNIMNHSYYAIDAGATCYNNVGYEGLLRNSDQNLCQGNYYQGSAWTKWEALFADGQDNLNYADTEGKPRTWVLKNPTAYVGVDGTPCGVTGGNFPWNPIPATPRILSTSVDAKTTPGTLKVSIKAEARPIE